MVYERSLQPLPRGKLSVSHYCSIHRHLFQDVYQWAGQYRTVRISKGDSVFCYPENIQAQMRQLFSNLADAEFFAGLRPDDFSAAAAHFLAELNATHPFREGNGRTQNTFLGLLAARAGHRLDFDLLDPATFLAAMIASFSGREDLLCAEIRDLLV
jgi:cell filamentation protein